MPRGLYFDDFEAGAEFISARRTITEADIVSFAGLSGDFNPLHVDEEYGKTTPFKTRIAHGLLVTAIATGLQNQMGVFEGTTLAVMDISLKFTGPTFPGDTIYIKLKIAGKQETKKEDRGLVFAELYAINHRGETVQEQKQTIMLARRPK